MYKIVWLVFLFALIFLNGFLNFIINSHIFFLFILFLFFFKISNPLVKNKAAANSLKVLVVLITILLIFFWSVQYYVLIFQPFISLKFFLVPIPIVSYLFKFLIACFKLILC